MSGTQRFVHDGSDRAGAATALRAAAEALVDLGRRAWAIRARLEARPHLVVREDVTMTDDH